MTLHDLYEQIAPTLPPSMQKDLRTAVRVLSHVLQHPDPHACPLEVCLHPLPTLSQLVETHLTSHRKGHSTIRNTKNLVSRLFREAEAKGLLTIPPAVLTPRFRWKQRRPSFTSEFWRRDGTHLPLQDWPLPLRHAFTVFSSWASNHVVDGRDARLRKRPRTLLSYQRHFEMYFGYLVHIHGLHQPCFEHLFNFPLIKSFLDWHINVKHHRVTRTAHQFLHKLLALTRQYRPQPELRAKLQALYRTLPPPTPIYRKSDAWVSLSDQEQVGLALWPQIPAKGIPTNGRRFAVYAGISLMLRLWVRIPYRQRNMREMQLHENLYRRDPHGTWHLRFIGEQLKIAVRKGQLNIFDLPFPDDLVPTLEDYLHTWRPRLTYRTPPPPEVFLSMSGRPYTEGALRIVTERAIHRYTAKRWHPHKIRTVWATEYIRQTSDFYGAAIMLNDTLETVIRDYAYLIEENVADKTYQWVHSHLPPRSTP